jgi:hypothetical protein
VTRRRRTFASLAGLAVLGTALAGCGGGDDMPPSSQIFTSPPWDGDERYVYELLDDRDEVTGTCEMLTEPQDDGTTNLSLLCGNDDGDRDDRVATVDSGTLTPRQSERTNINTDRDRTAVWRAVYSDDTVTVSTIQNGDLQNERERELPLEPEDEGDPQPGYYDDNTLLWLMRGIDLSLGDEYEAAFDDVNPAGLVQLIDTEVTIEDAETIEVPAGSFETWRIRFQTSDITQRVWVTQEAPHLMVKARLEGTEFQLTEIGGTP